MRVRRALGALGLVFGIWLGALAGPAMADKDEQPIIEVTEIQIGEEGYPDPEDPYTRFRIPIKMSMPWRTEVTVYFTTRDGTAVAPEDYLAIGQGQITFKPGETFGVAEVLVRKDAKCERDETFQFILTKTTVGRLGNSVSKVVILNDDRC